MTTQQHQKIKKDVISQMLKGIINIPPFLAPDGENSKEKYLNGIKEGVHIARTKDIETVQGIEAGIKMAKALEFATAIDAEYSEIKKGVK